MCNSFMLGKEALSGKRIICGKMLRGEEGRKKI